jgi:hypothetical protein
MTTTSFMRLLAVAQGYRAVEDISWGNGGHNDRSSGDRAASAHPGSGAGSAVGGHDDDRHVTFGGGTLAPAI